MPLNFIFEGCLPTFFAAGYDRFSALFQSLFFVISLQFSLERKRAKSQKVNELFTFHVLDQDVRMGQIGHA